MGVTVAEDGRGPGRADEGRSVRTGTSHLVVRSRPGFRRIREHVGRHVVVHLWDQQTG